MEYIDFKKLIDALTAKPKETEWLEFKHNFHSKEEIGERISALSNSAYLCNMPFGYIVFGVDDESQLAPTYMASRKWLAMKNLNLGCQLV